MVIPVLDARKDPRTDTLEQIASQAGEHPVMVNMPVIVEHQDRVALRLDHRHDQALCRRRAVI